MEREGRRRSVGRDKEEEEEEEFEGTAVACVYSWVHLKDPSTLFPI